jgi:hypothetical protein
MMAAESGDVKGALGRWRTAVAVDPGEYAKVLALGGLLLRQGRTTEARAYLELFAEGAPPSRYGRELASVRSWFATGKLPAGAGGAPATTPGLE